MNKLIYSKHFKERYQERIGGNVTNDIINTIYSRLVNKDYTKARAVSPTRIKYTLRLNQDIVNIVLDVPKSLLVTIYKGKDSGEYKSGWLKIVS